MIGTNWQQIKIATVERSRCKQTKEQASLEKEDRDYINSLADSKGQYEWMKEKRFKTIFRDIENKIQGAMGKGPFEGLIDELSDQASIDLP